MDIAQWWPRLSDEARDWLVEHNGEPLHESVISEILDATDGTKDPSWWSGDSVDGGSELTDEAVDWIEERANGE